MRETEPTMMLHNVDNVKRVGLRMKEVRNAKLVKLEKQHTATALVGHVKIVMRGNIVQVL